MSEEHKRKISEAQRGKPRPQITGAKNGFWKGGVTKEYQKTRRIPAYKEWRNAVFLKDNYTCQICDQYGSQYLHADHIKPYAEYIELRFEVSNGRTLCRTCHYYITFKRKMPEGSKWGLNHYKSAT